MWNVLSMLANSLGADLWAVFCPAPVCCAAALASFMKMGVFMVTKMSESLSGYLKTASWICRDKQKIHMSYRGKQEIRWLLTHDKYRCDRDKHVPWSDHACNSFADLNIPECHWLYELLVCLLQLTEGQWLLLSELDQQFLVFLLLLQQSLALLDACYIVTSQASLKNTKRWTVGMWHAQMRYWWKPDSCAERARSNCKHALGHLIFCIWELAAWLCSAISLKYNLQQCWSGTGWCSCMSDVFTHCYIVSAATRIFLIQQLFLLLFPV